MSMDGIFGGGAGGRHEQRLTWDLAPSFLVNFLKASINFDLGNHRFASSTSLVYIHLSTQSRQLYE